MVYKIYSGMIFIAEKNLSRPFLPHDKYFCFVLFKETEFLS